MPAWNQINNLLKAIYSGVDIDVILRHALRHIPTALNCTGIRIGLWESGRMVHTYSSGEPVPFRRLSVVDSTHADSILPIRWQRREQALRGAVLLPGHRELHIVLRQPEARTLANPDEAVFLFMLEHTARALEAGFRYTAARESAQVLAAALELVAWPVAVVDHGGHVIFRNQAAIPVLCQVGMDEALSEEDGWSVKQVVLPTGRTAAIFSQPLTMPPAYAVTPLLTPREREVALLVAQGLKNGQIARSLYITANTVKRHLKSAFRKLQVASRAELAAVLAREGEGEP